MSLKVFHLVFVGLSIFLGLFLGGWGIWASRLEEDFRFLILTAVGLGGAMGLCFYGVRAWVKLFRDGGEHV